MVFHLGTPPTGARAGASFRGWAPQSVVLATPSPDGTGGMDSPLEFEGFFKCGTPNEERHATSRT